jgi:hypothetical protein
MKFVRSLSFVLAGLIAAGCSEQGAVQPDQDSTGSQINSPVATFNCTGDVAARTLSCAPSATNPSGLKLAVIVGGQNGNVKIITGAPTYNTGTSEFTFGTTLQNLMSQSMGTTNGVTATAGGIRIFFASGPTVTSGSGVASVVADGVGTFTGPGQPYYEYTAQAGGDGILSPGETSGSRTWTLLVPNNATFTFTLLLYTDVQYPPASQTILKRIVAMGGANAAGFRSAGIVDSTQVNSYPAQIAIRAGAVFRVPLVTRPGCPAPVATFGTPPNVIGSCSVEVAEPLATTGKNVAVPGTPVTGLLVIPPGIPGTWNNLLLFGAHTQVERMSATDPTFVLLGGGDEDALQAALAGRLGPSSISVDSALTPVAVFNTAYTSITNAIAAAPSLQGAALVGVLDPLTYDPILQPGAYFFLARDAGGRFAGKPVNNNCSPVTALGAPNPLSTNLVSYAIIPDTARAEINCDPSVQNGDYLIDANEATIIHNRVAAYNATIQGIAASRNWVYVDPNAVFSAALTTVVSGRYTEIRKCQLLPSATTAAQFQTAVLNSCPVTGATAASPLGGSIFSQDGTTLSVLGQTRLANALAAAINTRYATSIPTSP